MKKLTLENNNFIDLYQVTGYELGSSVIITNRTNHQAEVIHEESLQNRDGFPIFPQQTCIVYGFPNKRIYIAGRSSGEVLVQQLTETIMPLMGVELAQDLMTSRNEWTRRVRVDPAQTGFFENREFISFKELSIPNGTQRHYIKITIPIDIIIHAIRFSVDAGSLRIRPVKNPVESGLTLSELPMRRKNQMSSAPEWQRQCVVQYSSLGTISGGEQENVFRIVAAGATAKEESIGSTPFSERGYGPCTLILELHSFGNETVTGDFDIFWEERPTS